VLDRLGVASGEDLRTIPADRLLAAQTQAATDLLFEAGTMPFHPVVDGDVVPSTPSVAITAGAAADVELLIGSTLHEMRLFPDPRADDLDDVGLTAWLRAYLRTRSANDPTDDTCARVLAAYRAQADGTNRAAGSDVWAAIQTDGVMRLPVERIAAAQAAHNPSTFMYLFAWESRDHERDPGAFHAIDLPFTFDTFDCAGWTTFLGVDDDARLLGARLRGAWAAFAATGDPSSPGVGTWPSYGADRPTMVLHTTPKVVLDPLAAPRALWDGLWDPSCRPAPVMV
jgi:para-nitrobenzyl esterase